MDIGDFLKPESNLYIYLLNGPFPRESEDLLGSSFVGNWVEGTTSFLFFSARAEGVVSSALDGCEGLEVLDRYHFTYGEWQGSDGSPVEAGRFLILPPWRDVPAAPDLIPIRLDPGVVFGSGLHPTTRDCLEALCFAFDKRPFDRLLDLGTGTGILAIAAAFLGARRVTAVDLNPLCVQTASRNVRLNRLERAVQVLEGSAEDFVAMGSDMVVANIHFGVVSRLLKTEGPAWHGWVLISGLMRSQWRDVRDRFEKQGFDLIREWDYDMTWFTLLARKRNPQLVSAHKSEMDTGAVSSSDMCNF